MRYFFRRAGVLGAVVAAAVLMLGQDALAGGLYRAVGWYSGVSTTYETSCGSAASDPSDSLIVFQACVWYASSEPGDQAWGILANGDPGTQGVGVTFSGSSGYWNNPTSKTVVRAFTTPVNRTVAYNAQASYFGAEWVHPNACGNVAVFRSGVDVWTPSITTC
jgi:hypothetical protein